MHLLSFSVCHVGTHHQPTPREMGSCVRNTLGKLPPIAAFIGHFAGEFIVQQKLDSLPPTPITLPHPDSEFKVHLQTGVYLAWSTAAFACIMTISWV